MSSSLTYVYCLVRSSRRPSLRGVPEPVPGSDTVRLLDVPLVASNDRRTSGPRHWLVVSTVPAAVYGERSLQRDLQDLDWVGPRALAHEQVIEHFLNADAVLPMQLFTLFKSDARAVDHVLANRRRIANVLLKVERQVEWGLRLMWDPAAIAAHKRSGARRTGRRDGHRVVSGAEYLTRKRDLRDRSRTQLKRAKSDANRLYRAIAGEASQALRRTDVERALPGSRLLLEAAFLVPVRRVRAFRAAVSRHTTGLEQSGIAVSLTGPWPPYNFI